ncbi:MAG: hypothetical protein Q7S02_03030 [bacterium]|nr:hypothetical protein [bacterium]
MNLLTPALRRRARLDIGLTVLRSIGAILLVYGLVAAIILLIGRTIAEWNFARVVERSTLVLRATTATSHEAQVTNEILLAIEEFQRTFTPWTVALTAITTHTPPGIILTTVTINRESMLRIEGIAATRDDLLTFQERLRELPYLSEVTIPFSNLLLRERIDFSIDAGVNRATVPL